MKKSHEGLRGLARRSVLRIQPYVPGKPIEEVQRELGLKDVIKLASNESPFAPSPKVIQALKENLKNLNRYPDGSCYYLRRALSRHCKVAGHQLIFGNGSDEIIVLCVRAFVDSGEEVVVAAPSFLIYKIACQAAGARIREVPLKGFHYDLPRMAKAVTKKTKIVFIGNPDNPVSTYVTEAQVKGFLKSLPSHVLVLLDEAYFEFVDEKDYPDSIGLLKSHPNLIITRTFSKMYALAGLRIGYGIARPETIDILERLREPFNVNSLAQIAAVVCLKEASYYRERLKRIKEQRGFLYQNFKEMGLSFVESVTNFILVDVRRDSAKVARALLEKGVIVRDMNFWGLRNFIRVTVGMPEENQKFIRALRGLVEVKEAL